jgi:hypothetical protein
MWTNSPSDRRKEIPHILDRLRQMDHGADFGRDDGAQAVIGAAVVQVLFQPPAKDSPATGTLPYRRTLRFQP